MLPLLSSFTALREIQIYYEFFDWRGAGDYFSGYRESRANEAANGAANDHDHNHDQPPKEEEAASRLAEVARRIVDQLPPNLDRIHVRLDTHSKDRGYKKAWLPRRVAFAKALWDAIEAGKFPRLRQAHINDEKRFAEFYRSFDFTRLMIMPQIRVDYLDEIVKGRTIDVYEDVTPWCAEWHQQLLRPGLAFSVN